MYIPKFRNGAMVQYDSIFGVMEHWRAIKAFDYLYRPDKRIVELR